MSLTKWNHSIVGKGNHSKNHIQKIKPRVEQVCQELGLQYSTEENEGRIYVNLTGGPAQMPPSTSQPASQQYPTHEFKQQPQPQQDEVDETVNDGCKCCVVM